MLLALDDTDGPDGGCTTYLAARILDELGPEARDGPPRLVRLDPDNPWKTRGNAAVALDLRDDLDPDRALETAANVLDERARRAAGKGAGVALFHEPPSPAWYDRGVSERVGLDEARRTLADARTWTKGTGRGLVGCLCAAAWCPDEHATYTRLAYREPEARGTPRAVDAETARELERSAEHVFDAYDATHDHALVAPRTPCPVLVGLRATRREGLPAAVEALAAEPIERAATFVANQASDDHLVEPTLAPLEVTDEAQRLEGGHVRLPARTPRGRNRDVLAFEPTGRLREGLLAVEPGDRVLALGSLKDGGAQVNAEKLLHAPADGIRPPTCPGCGGTMRSAGAREGYRCRRCGARAAGESDEREAAWYEADASARRHLARPLALGLTGRVREAERACLGANRGDRATTGPAAGPSPPSRS